MATPGSSTDMTETPDILHPLSSLEWEERPSLPVEIYNPHAVFLDGTLHVGGGYCNTLSLRLGSSRDHARLYSCKPGGDGSWTATDTPTYRYALTTYDSHLLLVGGREYPSEQITNKIYTMIDGEFKELLPPMKEKRYSTSAMSSGSVLAVAGGFGGFDGSRPLSSVEVYNSGQWTSGQSLPDARYDMKSVFHGDKWILIGGLEQGTKVYCVSLQSLVSGTEQSPWETLPDRPIPYSAAAVIGGRMLSIGGGNLLNPTTSVYAYSSDNQSWIHVGDLPTPLRNTCAIVVPSGELIVIGGETKGSRSKQVFRAFIKMPLVDANLQFSIQKLFQLHRYGIKLIEELSKDRFRFQVTSGVQLLKGDRQRAPSLSVKDYVELIFRAWLTSKRPTYPPTWESLFTVLRKMDLGHLLEQIGKYVTGSIPAIESSSQSSEPLVEEEGDSYQALREENQYLRKQLAQAEWSIQQLRGTEEQNLSGSEEEEESDDETLEQANRRLNSVVNDYKLTIGRLKTENKQLRAENDVPRSSLPVKLEPTDPLSSFKEEPEPSYQPSASSLQQPKQEEVLIKTEPETTPVTTETLLAPPNEVLMAESDATIKMHKEKVQQLFSENQTLRSQLALPAPLKTETTFNLPGVEVVGQTSVMVTKSEQSFHWTGYGFKLHIPQDSLPAGVDRCLLHISASIAGQYQFPDNMELVSAVYWVRCEPYCRFQQPLTAQLQHCAKMTSSTKLTFVRALCSQKHLPYTFKKLDGLGSFTNQSSYGSLQLDHFSGHAVLGENTERLYTASLYYLGSDTHRREINFVISWDDEPHISSVNKHYQGRRAISGPNQEIEFKEDKVSLDIPITGKTVTGGWTIVPLIHPTVTKKQVDNFKPGHRIPCCQLNAEFTKKRRKSVSKLFHQVKLMGAKDPYNIITIDLKTTPPAGRSKDYDTAALVRSDNFQESSNFGFPNSMNTGAPSLPLVSVTVANPETALSLPVRTVGRLRGSSLASRTPNYPGSLAHQHTGYYPTTFGSTAYQSPYHGPYQTGGPAGDSFMNFAGSSKMLSSGVAGSIEYPSVTIDQLVDHVGISKDLLDKPCSTEHLKTIASILPNWHKYAEALKLSDSQIQDIRLDPLLDTGMKSQKVMKMWHQANSFKATYRLLIEVCLQQRDVALANSICEMIKVTTTQSDDHFPEQSTSRPPSTTGEKRRQDAISEEEEVPIKKSRSEQSVEEQ